MQDSIDAFEIRMGEFSKLFHLDLNNPNRLALLENNCKYFANLFADLLRENYKLKDQIIENVR